MSKRETPSWVEVQDKWQELRELDHEELFQLLLAYDEYVYQVVNENQSEPVGVLEFYQYDYKEYVKGE